VSFPVGYRLNKKEGEINMGNKYGNVAIGYGLDLLSDLTGQYGKDLIQDKNARFNHIVRSIEAFWSVYAYYFDCSKTDFVFAPKPGLDDLSNDIRKIIDNLKEQYPDKTDLLNQLPNKIRLL
jgi:hypothetical protein